MELPAAATKLDWQVLAKRSAAAPRLLRQRVARERPWLAGAVVFTACLLVATAHMRTSGSECMSVGPAAPPSGFQRFGRAFVINLEHRTDRMANFTRNMDVYGVTNITVVRGVAHACPQLGLTLAHIAALQQCWASHWVESCLIMEDDFAVRLPVANATALIEDFYRDVHLWDVLMLSCNLQTYMTHDGRGHWCPPYAVRVFKGLSTSGYVVKRKYAPKITEAFVRTTGSLIDECAIYYANDVACLKLQTEDLWYTFPDAKHKHSVLGYQVPSFSDVVRTDTNYGV